jgi:hypothetical protein
MNTYSNELKQEISNKFLNGEDISQLSEEYNLQRTIIIYILKKVGVYVSKKHHAKWTNEEIDILKKLYKTEPIEKICELLPNHTYQSVYAKAYNIGLSRNEYRKNNANNIINKKLNAKIIYPTRQIFKRDETPTKIEYPKPKGQRKARDDWYTKYEMDYIIEHYKTMSDEEMGKILNRTKKSIQAKRLQLGIKRQGRSSYKSLHDFIRANNYEWKLHSMKNCHYKCVVSNKHFDEIHHIVSLNIILYETLQDLGYNVYDPNIANSCYYSDKELKEILFAFRKNQNKYPLGVCLTKEYHKKFHNIYGYGNNTENQWNEFCNKYI